MELFRELSMDEKATLIESLVEEPFHGGEVVIQQGDKGDAFYIIKSGTVRWPYTPWAAARFPRGYCTPHPTAGSALHCGGNGRIAA